ncbi:hypothetical protein ANPL_03835 [Anaplasma platys]|uniref:Uncharacterized protein n=1 Tax=Anaplasma platys TaxID=949 RepID=A0A858PZ26_9RICK|nr:hypothetical protein [Anaplasma platys]QJC27817.1 hypothetical protein ANPL_03835 [Anaplasma platys]
MRGVGYAFLLLVAVLVQDARGEECVGLLYAMMDCSAYRCVAKFSGDKVVYEVLGSSSKGCKYSESDKSGFSLCHVSRENFSVVSNYIVQLFTKSSNVRPADVARLKAKTCNFYRVFGNSFVKKEVELGEDAVREISVAVSKRMRKEEIEGIKSIFFSEEDLKKLG